MEMKCLCGTVATHYTVDGLDSKLCCDIYPHCMMRKGKMNRIYVAGGSDERAIVREFIARLVARGWEVTHDWTTDPGYDAPPSTNAKRRAANLDEAGVRLADVVWIVVPSEKSEGAAVEFGIARGLRKRTVVSGPDCARCLFWLNADHVFESHEAAMMWLGFADVGREVECVSPSGIKYTHEED